MYCSNIRAQTAARLVEVYFIPRAVVKHPATYIGTHAAFHKKKLKFETFLQFEAQDDQVVFVVSGLKVDQYQREKTFLEALYG